MPIKLLFEKLSKTLKQLRNHAPASPQNNPLDVETFSALNLLSSPDVKSIFDERNLRKIVWTTYVVVFSCCGIFVFFLNLNSFYTSQLTQLKNERDLLLSKVRSNLNLETKAYEIDRLQQQVTQLKNARVPITPKIDHIIKSIPSDLKLMTISYLDGEVSLLLDAPSASAYARFITEILKDKSVSDVVIVSVYLDTRTKEYRAGFNLNYE
ncbi:hypothetical protein KAZ57_04140 [Patescibacteria group bacterium]|nr:hypothetical protein [Patescibacteria group bacterium]